MEVDRDTLAIIHHCVSIAESKARRLLPYNQELAQSVVDECNKALDIFDEILGGM
jgi:hypothetical protein